MCKLKGKNTSGGHKSQAEWRRARHGGQMAEGHEQPEDGTPVQGSNPDQDVLTYQRHLEEG